MFRKFTQKRLLLAVTVVAMLAIGGSALAYFTSTGSGTGSATVGTATNWMVNGGSVVGNLYPDVNNAGPDLGVVTGASVTNPAATGHGMQNLNKIVATITAVTQGQSIGSEALCKTSDFQLYSPTSTWTLSNNSSANDTATINPVAQNLAPGGSYAITDLDVAMVDNGSAQDNCQGSLVTVTFNAS